MDIFGYYKYVTGVNNVNLLPNRDIVKSTERKKILSKVGIFAAALLVVLFVIGTFLYQYFFNSTLSSQYQTAVQIEKQVQAKEASLSALKAQKSKYSQMLEASKEFKTNQVSNYQLLSAVNQTVPGGVWFTDLTFENPSTLNIKGDAVSDQVIVNLVDRLQGLPMISHASLSTMAISNAPQNAQASGSRNAVGGYKQFQIKCVLKLDAPAANSAKTPPQRP